MTDPHDAPEDETPGERRARLMNLNNEGWHPDRVDKVDEVPPPAAEVAAAPKPEPEKPVSRAQSVRDQK